MNLLLNFATEHCSLGDRFRVGLGIPFRVGFVWELRHHPAAGQERFDALESSLHPTHCLCLSSDIEDGWAQGGILPCPDDPHGWRKG